MNPDLAQSFLRKLHYFDIFSHPLKADEIFDYCDFPDVDDNEGRKVLEELQTKNLINYDSGFYYIGDEFSKIVTRQQGNLLADKRMNEAKRYSTIVANFPFVRAVFISGSLSKHVMKPDSDIDFFIITAAGKLWLCRAFLTFFKKLFLFNSHRNLCLNYFIDTNNLEICDKNVFTATEIAFLIPMYNYSLYSDFMEKNNWYRNEFPNLKLRPEISTIKPLRIKKILEYLFSNQLGNILDHLSFSVILGFWKKKYRQMSASHFSLNFRSKRHISKHHPNAFQERVLHKYSEKIIAVELSTEYLKVNASKKQTLM